MISILGGAPRKLRDNVARAWVSPDGSRIVFVSSDKEIWLMNAAGEEPRRILVAPEADRLLDGPSGEGLAISGALTGRPTCLDRDRRTVHFIRPAGDLDR